MNNDGLFDKRIPQIDTLVFHWSLDNVTGSDASGKFFIHDTVSGSSTDVSNSRYGWYSDLTERSYPAQGDFFVSVAEHRDQAVDVEFVQTAKKKLPEVVNSDDMVKILNRQDDVVFTRETTYVQHMLSVEKSMYQIISEQMLKMFSTVLDFNDLIGQPVNRYRGGYKALGKLRNIFFEKVENQPDLEKFTEYFKWLDDAVAMMITQLIPASSNQVELLRNMVESHILERNKYLTKFPTLENKAPEPVLSTHGIEELKYNWKFGHHPLPTKTAATATITFSDSDSGNMAANQQITIISADGTSRTYTAKTDDAEAASSGLNFDIDGPSGGSISGTIHEYRADTLKIAIESSDGHNGKILVTRDGAVLTLTQVLPGASGNTTITENLTDCTVVSFSGGSSIEKESENCLWWKQRAERSGVLTSGDAGVDADKDVILKTYVTEVSSSSATLKTVDGAKYEESYYSNRSLRRIIDLETHRSLKLKGGGNSQLTNKHDFYKNVIKWASDDDFIFLDIDNEIQQVDCDDKLIPDEINKKRFNMNVLTMTAAEITSSNAAGTGLNDQKPTDGKASRLLPFSIFSSSVDTGYQKAYASQFKIDFTNLHEDKYGLDAEIPLQGPFSEKYVGGMQHRHVKLNQGSDTQLTRPEGWHLQPFLELSPNSEAILRETFEGATTTATNDINILSLPTDSVSPEPSPYEYWRNGIGTDNSWTFLEGATPTAGTGPASGKYAYCEVLPSKVGQTFGLVTPLIDLTEIDAGCRVDLSFSYHMHGLHIGNLKVQASRYRNFSRGVKDLVVQWPTFQGTTIAGQQHLNSSDSFSNATVSTEASSGAGLLDFIGKRFYIRFLYTAGITHLGDIAIDSITIIKNPSGESAPQDSFK